MSDEFAIDADFRLQLFGRHNALNALASICIGIELGVDVQTMQKALADFSGIARRFNVYPVDISNSRSISVIDDYGHHPTEISSVLDTVKQAFAGRRLIFVFEPHRYSRVKALFDGFVEAMLPADYQLLMPIYAASEKDTLGMASSGLCDALRSLGAKNAHSVANTEALFDVLDRVIEDGDVVLFMGAGSIGKLAKAYIKEAGL